MSEEVPAEASLAEQAQPSWAVAQETEAAAELRDAAAATYVAQEDSQAGAPVAAVDAERA